MTRSECLKRAAKCPLVEAVSDPKMKLYLMRLALSWMPVRRRCGRADVKNLDRDKSFSL